MPTGGVPFTWEETGDILTRANAVKTDGDGTKALMDNGEYATAGNVNVTNAGDLKKGSTYVFTPSADGSAAGTFSKLENASANTYGLMSASDYKKLDGMKEVTAFPAALLNLTAASTSTDILTAFGTFLENNLVENPGLLIYLMAVYASNGTSDYDKSLYRYYVGNHECALNASFDGTKTSGTLELTYVAPGGKLRTIRILGKANTTDGNTTYAYSCETAESGDDTYYLPYAINNLNAGSTYEQILSAFGGEEGFAEIKEAMSNRKKLYLANDAGDTTLLVSYPVSCFGFLSAYIYLLYDNTLTGKRRYISCNKTGGSFVTEYPLGTKAPYVIDEDFLGLVTSDTNSADAYGKTYETVTGDNILAKLGGKAKLGEIATAFKENRLEVYQPAAYGYTTTKARAVNVGCFMADSQFVMGFSFLLADSIKYKVEGAFVVINGLDTDTPTGSYMTQTMKPSTETA